MKPNLKELIENVRKEAERIGYADSTLREYQKVWNSFLTYSSNHDIDALDINLIPKFLKSNYGIEVEKIENLSYYHREKYRCMVMLIDFDYYKEYIRRPLPKKDKIKLNINYQDILSNYLIYSEKELYNSQRTLEEKNMHVKRFLKFLENNNHLKIENINIDIIKNYLDSCYSTGSKKKYTYLRTFLRYLYLEKLLKSDLSYKIPKPKEIRNKRVPTYLKADDIEKLLNIINIDNPINKRNYAMVLLASKLGLRISDIKNLKFENIDWVKNAINIVQVKTNKSLTLPISKEIGWAIIDYIKNYRPKTDSKYIFVKHAVPYDKLAYSSCLQEELSKYFEKANIKVKNGQKKGMHSLRHSFATVLLENGNSIDIISSLLGHSNKNTSTTYTKVDTKKLKQCGLDVVVNESI